MIIGEHVDFDELIAAVRLVAKSALRNPERTATITKTKQEEEVAEKAYRAWSHRYFRELQTSPQSLTVHEMMYRKADRWLHEQRAKGRTPTYRDLAMRFGWKMWVSRFIFSSREPLPTEFKADEGAGRIKP